VAAKDLDLTRSKRLFAEAQAILPGGVSSPVRAFKSVEGDPIFMQRGEGAVVWDEDGNEYIDYCCSWGPLAVGHAHPKVVAAIAEAAARGTTFGTPTVTELRMAQLVQELQPLAERLRFVSSGTEAVMSAVRASRGFTGRELLVKFDGCYHGHADYLLVKAGSGLATIGQPDSAGVPAGMANTTVVADLNDPEGFKELMAKWGEDVAAVIVEPLPANCGLLVQDVEFLRLLRSETKRYGSLLIFDEVISGFRLGPGGMAAETGIEPDLLTFGKVIGGGLPVGAYAGRKDVMDVIAPLGPVYQAGTLSGNPVAMAAGHATLELLRDGGWDALAAKGEEFERLLTPILKGFQVSLVRKGSIFWFAFQDPAPRAWRDVDREGASLYKRFHAKLLERGVYLAPSAFEVGFISTAHDSDQLEHTAQAIGDALTLAVDKTRS